MNLKGVFLVMALAVFAGGCSFNEDVGFTLYTEIFDFSGSLNGWTYGFSDYPATQDDSIHFELKSDYNYIPGLGNVVMLSGKNVNSDLFMFLKRKITGLRPETNYTLSYEVEVACESKNVTVGSGYGQKVYLKVGGVSMEPKSVIDGGHFEMNINKGQHMDDGSDMRFVGTITSPYTSSGYTNVNLNNSVADKPFTARSNNRGELWLIVGTDSDFNGQITLFYKKITVVMTSSQ